MTNEDDKVARQKQVLDELAERVRTGARELREAVASGDQMRISEARREYEDATFCEARVVNALERKSGWKDALWVLGYFAVGLVILGIFGIPGAVIAGMGALLFESWKRKRHKEGRDR